MIDLLAFVGFLLATVLVVFAAWRYRVPYTLALVLAGLTIGIALGSFGLLGVPNSGRAILAPGLFFTFLLPPIIFEAALQVRLPLLRARAGLILYLVIAGVVVATVVTGSVLAWLAAVPLAVAFLIAAILSPTDPIAVVALLRRLRVPQALSTIVEGEAIFNDAIGVTLFLVLLGLLGGTAASVSAVLAQFVWLVVGGGVVGGASAVLVYLLRKSVRSALGATALTVVLAFGSFWLATDLGASGILATAIAGLAASRWLSDEGSHPGAFAAVASVWRTVAYGVNSIVFLGMGLLFGTTGLLGDLPVIVAAFALLLAGRLAVVAAARPALGLDPALTPDSWSPILTLGGVRGAIPVVLALSLVTGPEILTPSALSQVLATVFGVVLLSILLQDPLASWYARRTWPRGASEAR